MGRVTAVLSARLACRGVSSCLEVYHSRPSSLRALSTSCVPISVPIGQRCASQNRVEGYDNYDDDVRPQGRKQYELEVATSDERLSYY